ncbi:MAG: Hpt domain-containing protein [Deltaproteobacteria bacterium]|nr:Hpt domain-containing protein [Deltaproteobacteria bacterium]
MADQKDDFEESFALLRQNYLQAMIGKIQEVESAWNLVQKADNPREHLKTLYLLAHNLSGSGAIYGFSALSDSAHQLEILVKPIHEGGGLPDAAQAQQIHELVGRIQADSKVPSAPLA